MYWQYGLPATSWAPVYLPGVAPIRLLYWASRHSWYTCPNVGTPIAPLIWIWYQSTDMRSRCVYALLKGELRTRPAVTARAVSDFSCGFPEFRPSTKGN